MLKQEFFNCLKDLAVDSSTIDIMWAEIHKHYSKSDRHYHTLGHLDNLLLELLPCRNQFRHWGAVIFAIAYHDIIYNTLKSNNEEKSAEVAVKILTFHGCHPDQTNLCEQYILATKSHLKSEEEEINLFTDADLSVLGKDWEVYKIYSQQIRKEYSLYPDLIYNAGRKKVLEHFLGMPSIYKTDFFCSKYEKNARKNLQQEFDIIH